MKVRIYKPAKTAMQSGFGKTKEWLLETEPTPKILDPLLFLSLTLVVAAVLYRREFAAPMLASLRHAAL